MFHKDDHIMFDNQEFIVLYADDSNSGIVCEACNGQPSIHIVNPFYWTFEGERAILKEEWEENKILTRPW